MHTILIADDEPNIRRMVGALLRAEDYDVIETGSGAEAVARVTESEPDAVILDLMMPGDTDGIIALEKIRKIAPDLPVIMMSGRAGLSDAVKATRLGAFNFLEKPLTPESVLLAVASAVDLRQTRQTARALREELGIGGEMVGGSAAIKAVRDMIARVAGTDARVLITGESGTGKELVAAAIHNGSARRDKPFIRVNCAAIPRDLVESEMFGHERGAFTGATQSRAGRFELANRGTLFLDEVGDLGADAQAKLLRAIESQEIQRVGGNKVIKTDVRILSATNHDLVEGVDNGDFREDLYFRLNVIPLTVAPLRDRRDDVPLLIEHFSAQFFRKTGRTPPHWRRDAIQRLQEYKWPGNVRELANVVERIAILHAGAEITQREIDEILTPEAARISKSDGAPAEDSNNGHSLSAILDSTERGAISRALADARGNVAEAARKLETDRANLYRRMKRLGIPTDGV